MRKLLICLCLATLIFVIYWPVRHFDFVNYDDEGYVYENPHVAQGLTWQTISWAFGTSDLANYHPLTWMSFELDASLFGLKPGPLHLENVLIHAINTVLVFLVLASATGNMWPSLFVAAIFGLHPVHVESVAWISERKDVLSTLCFLLALAAYLRFVRAKSPRTKHFAYAGMTTLFILGLLAKPMVVTFPFVLLLLDYWPLRRAGWRRLVYEKLPLIFLAIVSCIVTMQVQQAGGATMSLAKLPFTARLETAVVSYGRYLGKIFWPTNLSIFYPHPLHWPPGWVIASAAVLVIVTALCIWSARRWPFFIVGWFFFLGTLVPVIGLVQAGWQSIADRYLYLPLIGPAIMVAWGARALINATSPISNTPFSGGPEGRAQRPSFLHHITSSFTAKTITTILAVTIILASTLVTAHQLQYWKDTRTLFDHALAVTNNNTVAHVQLGYLDARQGNFAGAYRHYEEAIHIDPTYYVTEFNMGNLLLKDHPKLAIQHYRKADQDRPGDARVQNNWGIALMSLHPPQPREAFEHFHKAVQLDSDFMQAHYNLGKLLLAAGQYDPAIAEFQAALRLDPTYAPARRDLQKALAARTARREPAG